MTDRQKAFCREYLLDLNQTAAAIRAGYAPESAAVTASKLMRDPRVLAQIEAGKASRAERTEIDADRVIAELAKIGFASMRQFISIDGNGQPAIDLTSTPLDDLDALAEVSTETVVEGPGEAPIYVRKTKIKLHDKIKALMALAEHTGAFSKRDEGLANAFADAFKQLVDRGSKAPLRRTGGTS
ncbi:terminase small subunit [Frigidibacter oleivorans]|uniref:terminase small subunit n=1 Tax=Frigidibacter oleivorans TaxID=2487129 RepID=UPI0013E040E7|nr:terminase small subunit [Frigidibacter oleivorans]